VAIGSAQQLLNQCLHVTTRLALGDESADITPAGCEMPRRLDFKFCDGLLQFGSPCGEATMEIVGWIVQGDRQLPNILVEVALVLPEGVSGSSPVFGFRGIQNSLDYFDVLIHLTGLGQATIDATNQVAYAVGVAQAEGQG